MTTRAHASRFGSLRREIAALAARMMAEDGISDFGFAKRKAARQLGAGPSDDLPNNNEIEAELRAWQALYQDEEHDERLTQMRRTAVDILQFLAPYRPYLTGGALDGTAGRYSELEIEAFPDSSKDVEIHFLNHNIAYEHREPRRPAPNQAEAALIFDWDEVPVRLSLYERFGERHNNKGTGRANLAAVQALLAGGAAE